MDEHIQIKKWAEIRGQIQLINPRLVQLIDEIDPSEPFDFIKVTYHFGQPIIKNGQFQLPVSSTKTVPITEKEVPVSIKQRLDYSPVPIILILSKKAEVFYEGNERVMPTKIQSKGSLFGLWEMFDPPPGELVQQLWNITAGARSLFMLPKISNQFLHKQLQHTYKIQAYAPNDMLHHHAIFTEIANAETVSAPWAMDVLIFSKSWQTSNFEKDFSRLQLHCFLLHEAWRQSANCRNNMSFDMAWESFSQAVAKRNMKPKPLIVNTLKHLRAIREGFYPGYAPAIDDESGPIKLLMEAYSEIYKITHHPTIMEPTHLSKKNRPVYYSMQYPTLIEYAPGVQGKNIIIDERELKILNDMLENSLNEPVSNFTFFHPEADTSLNIKSAEELPQLNAQFMPDFSQNFAASSPFLKGCVQVSLTEDRVTPLAVEAIAENYPNKT